MVNIFISYKISWNKTQYIFEVIDQILANEHLTFARSVIYRKFTPRAARFTQDPRGPAIRVTVIATGRPIKGAVHTGVHMRDTERWVAVSVKKIGIIDSNVWIYPRSPYCLYGYLKELNKINKEWIHLKWTQISLISPMLILWPRDLIFFL